MAVKRFFESQEQQRDKNKRKKLHHVKLDPDAEKLLLETKAKAPASEITKLNVAKFSRGPETRREVYKALKDRKVKGQLRETERLFRKSARTAAQLEKFILPTEGGILEAEGAEETEDIKQEQIVAEVDILSSRKAFDLKLPVLGPYCIDYNQNGRFLLLGGRKGHISLVEWNIPRLIKEFEVKETIHDVKFLHNEQFFAAAQKKYIYIYNKNGAEVHCLKEFRDPLKLEFLRSHFLLSSINNRGILHYQDTSTGRIVANHNTRLGRCDVMRVNPYNAVLNLGHSNGTVTMWSPNLRSPLVTMLCHKGPVTALALDIAGNYMVTSGTDSRIKVWDIRKLKEVHSYASGGSTRSLDISQKGLVAVGVGRAIEIWKDAFAEKQHKPYMKHRLLQTGSVVQDLSFCPYEDVLGIGHSLGFSSMLVPGSGEPNFDTFVANPFETTKQRHEAEVHALLDKLQPEMIMLEPDKVASVKEPVAEAAQQEDEEEDDEDQAVKQPTARRIKHKKKGRSKPGRVEAKKQEQAFSAKRSIIRQQNTRTAPSDGEKSKSSQPLPRALARFET